MIMRFLKKIPAGMMVVPMLLGAIINTFLPEVTNIGSFTTAVFTSAGANTAIGIQLFCLGTTLRVRDMGGVVKRGGVLLISKFVIGAAIGIVVGKVFGPTGVLGLSSLAIISAVTNSNGSIYLALMNSYGDTVDQAAMPLLAINDGPMLTMIAMGIGGLTCLEEKSLGCIHKGGHSPVMAVYDYAKQVEAKQGLVIMDTPGNDPSSVAAMVAGGAQIVVFSTGRGTPTGNPLAPVIKITGNKLTYANMIDNIDVDASPLIYGTKTIEELGQELLKLTQEVACGKQTKAESLGYTEMAIARVCNFV